MYLLIGEVGEEPSDFRTGQTTNTSKVTNLQQPAVFVRLLQAEQGS